MNEFVVRYLVEKEYNDWDRFVEESEYGTIFHKVDWNRLLYKLSPDIKLSIIGCYKQNRLVGGIIFGWKKKIKRFRIIVPPYASCFYGVLIQERNSIYVSKCESYRFSVLNELLSFVEKEFHFVSIALPPDFKDIRVFTWRKYATRILYTYRGDISSPNKILNAFQPAVRRQIKKGKKYNYEFRKTMDENHLKTIYSLLEKTYKRQKHFFRFSKTHFIELIKNPGLNTNFRAYSIWLDSNPVAALIIIVKTHVAYYWLSGADHNYFNTGLNQLLLWLVINELSKEGVTIFDLVGANTPTIANYKSSFNFELTPYYHVSIIKGRTTRLLFKLKNILTGSNF